MNPTNNNFSFQKIGRRMLAGSAAFRDGMLSEIRVRLSRGRQTSIQYNKNEPCELLLNPSCNFINDPKDRNKLYSHDNKYLQKFRQAARLVNTEHFLKLWVTNLVKESNPGIKDLPRVDLVETLCYPFCIRHQDQKNAELHKEVMNVRDVLKNYFDNLVAHNMCKKHTSSNNEFFVEETASITPSQDLPEDLQKIIIDEVRRLSETGVRKLDRATLEKMNIQVPAITLLGNGTIQLLEHHRIHAALELHLPISVMLLNYPTFN